MGKRRFTEDAYSGVAEKVKSSGGDTSFAGRERQKQKLGLDPLVDPAGYGLIRKSWPRYMEQDGLFFLPNGMPMLFESLLDTTGSMGGNVRLAFDSLPKAYKLLAGGESPVLGRYDTQILNAIFGDKCDEYILYRSQAEMDAAIAEQLTLMVAEGGGGDTEEDPEYGLFGASYLTDAFVNRLGLKSYHSTVTDAPGRGKIDEGNLIRVFGKDVFDKVKENGHQINGDKLPKTSEIVTELAKRAHAFLIQVGGSSETNSFWKKVYDREHIVQIDSTKNLAFVNAAIIGLTEGVLDLQTVTDFLRKSGCSKEDTLEITESVSGIPIGAQAMLPNFGKIPLKGSVFQKKHDLIPVSLGAAVVSESEEKINWL